MRSTISFSLIIAIVFSIFAVTASVEAKSSKKPSRAAVKRARIAYSKGQEYFNAGQYQEALESFQDAYDAVPKAVVLLSIAESQKNLGELENAVETLELYLQERHDAPDRDVIEEKINAIKNTPAKLLVISDPPGAMVSVDGLDTGKFTPAEIELKPGNHDIEVSLNDKQREYKTIVARPGRRHDMQVEFGPIEDGLLHSGTGTYGDTDDTGDDGVVLQRFLGSSWVSVLPQLPPAVYSVHLHSKSKAVSMKILLKIQRIMGSAWHSLQTFLLASVLLPS